MKKIFPIFVIATIAFGFTTADTFKQSFQKVFIQSIKGLESLKGTAMDGGNKSTVEFADFDKAIIKKDESLGVLGVVLSKKVDTEDKGNELLAKFEAEVVAALPAGDYERSQSYNADYVGYMKTVYDFHLPKMAEKQKRPTIEMGVTNKDGILMVVVAIYEPFFKNQYTPKMP